MIHLIKNIYIMEVYKIPYPQRMTEFEIQSLLFGILKKEGFKVRGEVKAYKSRLDVVVYDDNYKARVIIEVKARKRIRAKVRKYKQVIKYEELFGLPVIVCLNQQKVTETINQVKGIMNG